MTMRLEWLTEEDAPVNATLHPLREKQTPPLHHACEKSVRRGGPIPGYYV